MKGMNELNGNLNDKFDAYTQGIITKQEALVDIRELVQLEIDANIENARKTLKTFKVGSHA